MAGFGKYSPKIIAESSLPGAPRIKPLVTSKRRRNGQKSQATVALATMAPTSCATM
jgi:hypothetical protein